MATATKTKQHVLYVKVYRYDYINPLSQNPTPERVFFTAYYPTTRVDVTRGKIVIYYKDHKNKNRQVSYYTSQFDVEVRREVYSPLSRT